MDVADWNFNFATNSKQEKLIDILRGQRCGTVMRYESSSSFRTVYTSSPKTVKVVLSSDEKNFLIPYPL